MENNISGEIINRDNIEKVSWLEPFERQIIGKFGNDDLVLLGKGDDKTSHHVGCKQNGVYTAVPLSSMLKFNLGGLELNPQFLQELDNA